MIIEKIRDKIHWVVIGLIVVYVILYMGYKFFN